MTVALQPAVSCRRENPLRPMSRYHRQHSSTPCRFHRRSPSLPLPRSPGRLDSPLRLSPLAVEGGFFFFFGSATVPLAARESPLTRRMDDLRISSRSLSLVRSRYRCRASHLALASNALSFSRAASSSFARSFFFLSFFSTSRWLPTRAFLLRPSLLLSLVVLLITGGVLVPGVRHDATHFDERVIRVRRPRQNK